MKKQAIATTLVRHIFSYVEEPGEKNGEPSMTQPDMTMSISEILNRFAAGRPPSFQQNLRYTGEEFRPEMRGMDLVEQNELIKANAARISELETSYKEKQQKRSEARKNAIERNRAIMAKAEEMIKAEKSGNNEQGTSK